MKTIIVAAALMLPAFAFAQANVSGQNSSTAMTAATIASGAVAITSIGSDKVRTNQQAPSESFSSSFAADSCASGAGGSLGTFPVAFGVNIPWSPNYCISLRVFERLEQASAIEKRPDVQENERDAALAVIGNISPTFRALLSEHHLLKGNDAVESDASGTVGLQPASTRIDAPVYATAQTK